MNPGFEIIRRFLLTIIWLTSLILCGVGVGNGIGEYLSDPSCYNHEYIVDSETANALRLEIWKAREWVGTLPTINSEGQIEGDYPKVKNPYTDDKLRILLEMSEELKTFEESKKSQEKRGIMFFLAGIFCPIIGVLLHCLLNWILVHRAED